jgi:hypothetical protein
MNRRNTIKLKDRLRHYKSVMKKAKADKAGDVFKEAERKHAALTLAPVAPPAPVAPVKVSKAQAAAAAMAAAAAASAVAPAAAA